MQGLDSSNVTIIGSPSAINVALEDLKYVGVQGSGNIEITVDSKDEVKSALEKGTLSINVVDNQPPEPGGDLVFKSSSDISQNAAVNEDTTSNVPTITFSIPVAKLVNSDGETPTDIRILSVDGGTLKFVGQTNHLKR